MNALIQHLPDPEGNLDIVLFEDKTVGVRWAGCLYGPAQSIEEVLTPASDICKAAAVILAKMHEKPDLFKKTKFIDVDNGLGLLEVGCD